LPNYQAEQPCDKMQNVEPNLILKSIEKISNTFKDSELTELKKRKLTKSLKEDLKVVSGFLHCTDDESWLFSVMFAMSISGKETDLDSLTNYLGCNPFLIVGLSPVLDCLVSKRLLIKNAGYDMTIIATRFHISSYIFNAISLNKPIPKSNHFADVYEVIEKINEMICERERNSLSTDELFTEAFSLARKEEKFSLIKKLFGLGLGPDDTLLLFYLCYSYANDSNEADVERYVYYVYDSMGSKIRAKKHILSGNSMLFDKELVAFVDDNFYGGKELSLTDKAVDLLFAEDGSVLEKSKNFQPKNCLVFTPENIKPVNLFFNEKEESQIKVLVNLLQEENYQIAKAKFVQHNMPAGLTTLFYGTPGTGKTQIAYNLAQATNRTLLMVDISAIRDKYVGESEKRIKQIFKSYKQACEHYPIYPILFFNESDALISKRYEVSSSVDQMNNSMQNILLQELEDFEGILIATSNLNMNLDNAFERRFLYKIAFNNPEENTSLRIWKDKMPEISEEDAKILAKEYALSGGQINNICRKYVLSHILKNDKLELEELKELCEEEFFGKASSKKLGFNS